MAKRVTSTSGTPAPKSTRHRGHKKTAAPAETTPVQTTPAVVEPAPAAETTPVEVAAAAVVATPEEVPAAATTVESVSAPATVSAPVATPETTTPAADYSNGHYRTTDQIAQMAYFFWQERGCPNGSPDEDWLRAERELAHATRN